MLENMEDTHNLSKEDDEFVKLSTSDPGCGSENINNHSSTNQSTDSLIQPGDCGDKEAQLNGEILVIDKSEHAQVTLAANNEHDTSVMKATMQFSVEVNDSTIIENKISMLSENGSVVQDGKHKRNENPVNDHEIDAVSGTKRSRKTVDEQQASVHVIYNSLTRESKQKLEELLQKWSEWHARHNSSSRLSGLSSLGPAPTPKTPISTKTPNGKPILDSKVDLESGEGTYFPAINVGVDKPSAVSYWIDGQARNSRSNDFIALDNNSIPLYDRGYSFGLTSIDGSSNLEGGLEVVDGSRCFNCGSYNHALKECPKPRDNAAVNSARKQHKARRNQSSINRNPTRYYQDTPGGRFDGLQPGVLDAETRKLLGLGELDPPPWLNRMREIGYPPGYLDADDEDLPSGIEIFGEEVVVKQETEDGEILDMDISPPPLAAAADEPPTPKPPKKMSVRFPGVNAPIPENADAWRWEARAWKFDLPRNRSNHRYHNSTTEPASRPHLHEERWNRDYRDDGPPGVDPGSGGPLPSSFMPRYAADHDSRGSSYGRSMSERGRRSPLYRESSSSSHDDERWKPHSSEYWSHQKDRHEERHHRSWR